MLEVSVFVEERGVRSRRRSGGDDVKGCNRIGESHGLLAALCGFCNLHLLYHGIFILCSGGRQQELVLELER